MSQHVDETNPESEATPETPYLYETEWQPKQAVAQDRAPHRSGWLILPDRAGVGLELGALLEARGEQCVIAAIAERGPEALQSRLREAFGDVAPRGVVFLASLDISEPAAFQAAEESGWGSALDLVHALVRTERGDAPRLWLVTRNSQAVGTDPAPVNPAQAPLWGLGKVIAIEHPELRCTKVDLGPSANPEETADLLRELLADDLEDQVAWRNGVRYVARLVTRQQKREHTPSTGKPFRLAIPAPGILDRLTLQPTSRETPGAGQVEIQVHAAGLNFNDVMKAMGIYPGLPDGPVPLGSECSGTVVAVGPEVDGLAVGDAVVAVAPFSFSSYVTAAAPLVVPKPPQISFEEAAAIPLAFLTAVYALRHLGQLAEGDRVLIHSASGGVGLAAVQIAQQAGAEIFATAGSPEKRAFLESLGVHHVMDSRSLTFAREVMAFTGGRGVDVVLNSLAGEGMRKSLEILAPFGRFLEIGKRDIYENRELGLAPFRKHLSYFSIDLERLFAERPAVGVRLLREVMQSFESGAFQPLRLQVFPVTEVVSAFREMAQARHIGKIVVSLQNREQAPASEPETAIRTDSAYLITGGLGGLGLVVAQWMVAQGARHLALMGRSEPSAEARKTLEALERDGAQVLVVCADVSQREQVAGALAEIDRSMPNLAGIIHAAGIQDDGVLLHLTRERFRSVMAPKVAGAWNLHTLTADRKLDFFVLFSSAASLIGSPGQGNYAAANAYLDGLAHYRRANGQPALSINWGAWSQVGLAARMDGDERMVRLGMLGLTPQQGVDVLGGLLRHSAAQVGVMRVQVRSWLELFPKAAEWPFLAHLALEEAPSVGRRPHESPLRKALLASPAGQHRRALLESRLQQELARILRINPSQVGRTAPLQSFGLDSISAVELRNRWSEELGLLLSATLIWDHPTISALATHLADKMEIPLDSAEAATLAQDAERTAVVAQIRELSEEQAEALLIQTLSTIEAKRP
jgi:NADPH:quinone reductase-like Zn-dependent oxidoreductase/acyl carrier protein